MWFGSSVFNVVPLDSFVSNGCKSWIFVWVVLWVGCWGNKLGLVCDFSLNPNAFNESCLVVWKEILFGVVDFLFGAIVLSKINVLLGLMLVVYTLSLDVLDIVGCQVGVLIDE